MVAMALDTNLGGGSVVRLGDGREVVIRAARDGDEALIQAFIARLSLTSRYQRFFMPLHGLSAAVLDRLVHSDARCEAALLALSEDREVLGLVQYVGPQTRESAEVAVVVADAWRRIGLGAHLLRHLERVATAAGVERVEADILRDNVAAIDLASKLGARIGKSPNGGAVVRVIRPLTPVARPSPLFEKIIPKKALVSLPCEPLHAGLFPSGQTPSVLAPSGAEGVCGIPTAAVSCRNILVLPFQSSHGVLLDSAVIAVRRRSCIHHVEGQSSHRHRFDERHRLGDCAGARR
jgi:GNAT superfamily N-acetyltransferase